MTQPSVIQHRYMQHLGKDVYLFDSVFNGEVYIHVRKLSEGKFPTKDGISLTIQRCNELFMSLPFLEDYVSRREVEFYRRHLGGNWQVTVQSGFNCVDIRKFWFPESSKEIQATRKGVSLTFEQFNEFKTD
jgi:hypothetical protein